MGNDWQQNELELASNWLSFSVSKGNKNIVKKCQSNSNHILLPQQFSEGKHTETDIGLGTEKIENIIRDVPRILNYVHPILLILVANVFKILKGHGGRKQKTDQITDITSW